MTVLQKPLTFVRGTAIMLNIVVGAGLLALPGLVYRDAGPFALVSWVACAAVAAPLAAIFAILARMYPNAGGIAHFAELGFGRRGYIVASMLFLGAVAFGLPAIALTGGYHAARFVGGSPHLAAVLLVLAATMLHLAPSALVARANTSMAGVTIVAILGLSAVGWAVLSPNPDAAMRLVPSTDRELSQAAAPFMMIFFAFTGWEVAAGLAEEFRNPRRDFPRAMLASFVLTLVIYLTVAGLVQHLAPAYGYETTFTQIAEAVLGQSGSDATAILGSIIILANLSGAIWAVSRLLFAMSREGFLPAFLQDAPDGTPWLAVGVTMTAILSVVGLDLLGVLPLDRMLSLAGQNFLILYAIAAVALMLRSREWPHRILGLAVAILAAALVAAQETLTLYPLLLVGLGLLVHRKSIAGRRAAAPPAPAVNVSGRSPQPAAESAS